MCCPLRSTGLPTEEHRVAHWGAQDCPLRSTGLPTEEHRVAHTEEYRVAHWGAQGCPHWGAQTLLQSHVQLCQTVSFSYTTTQEPFTHTHNTYTHNTYTHNTYTHNTYTYNTYTHNTYTHNTYTHTHTHTHDKVQTSRGSEDAFRTRSHQWPQCTYPTCQSSVRWWQSQWRQDGRPW